MLPNRTFIDQSVHRLRKSAELLAFAVPTGVSDTVLIRRTEFLARLDRSVRLLETQRLQTRGHDQLQQLQAKLDALTHLRRAIPQLCGLQTITMSALVQAFNGNIETLDEQAVRTDVMYVHQCLRGTGWTQWTDLLFHGSGGSTDSATSCRPCS